MAAITLANYVRHVKDTTPVRSRLAGFCAISEGRYRAEASARRRAVVVARVERLAAAKQSAEFAASNAVRVRTGIYAVRLVCHPFNPVEPRFPMSLDMSLMRPEHTRVLEGWHYVVLRPGHGLARVHRQMREEVQRRLPSMPVSYPAPHVTLGAFPAGADCSGIVKLVSSWSEEVPVLRVETRALRTFSPPHMFILLELTRTTALFNALVALRKGADAEGLAIVKEVAADDWIFHLSIAYCSELASDAWDELVADLQHVVTPQVASTIVRAEVLTFNSGVTSSCGDFALRGGEHD